MASKHIHIHFSDSSFSAQTTQITVDGPENNSAKEAAAVLGHFGGAARAASLAPGRRKQIATKAAKARWRKHKAQSGKSLEPSNK